MISIARVAPSDSAALWAIVGPLLGRSAALSRGRYDIDDMARGMAAGEFDLVVIKDDQTIIGALTFAIKVYPKMRVLEVRDLGGDRFHDWKHQLNEAVDRLAKAADCVKIEFIGRAGWGKLLAPGGYEPVFVIYEKAITP